MITINNIQFKEGDLARVTIDTWQGELSIVEGTVKYKDSDMSSYGVGWGIEDKAGRFTFFSSISKGNTKLVKINN